MNILGRSQNVHVEHLHASQVNENHHFHVARVRAEDKILGVMSGAETGDKSTHPPEISRLVTTRGIPSANLNDFQKKNYELTWLKRGVIFVSVTYHLLLLSRFSSQGCFICGEVGHRAAVCPRRQ